MDPVTAPTPARPTTARAVGIVRWDICGPAAQGAAAGIAALLGAHRIPVDQILFPTSPAELGHLLAWLPEAVTIVAVPSGAHLGGGWLSAAREHRQVWSVQQGVCWPQGEGHPRPIWRPAMPRRVPGTTWRALSGEKLAGDTGDSGPEPLSRWLGPDPETLRRVAEGLRQLPHEHESGVR